MKCSEIHYNLQDDRYVTLLYIIVSRHTYIERWNVENVFYFG